MLFSKKTAVAEPEQKADEATLGLQALQKLKESRIPIENATPSSLEETNLLKELGFTKMTERIEKIGTVLAKENMAALSGYTRISRDTFNEINRALRDDTRIRIDDMGGRAYLEIRETSVADYTGVPPKAVLEEMKKAKDSSIFSSFSILHLSKREIPDPILVGHIEGSNDMYHIAEWGEDIKLDDFSRFEKEDKLGATEMIDGMYAQLLSSGSGYWGM